MPARLAHVVDESAHEDGVRVLSLLLRLLPATEVPQRVIVIGRPPAALEVPEGVQVSRVAQRLAWPITAALDLQRRLRDCPCEAVLAWSAGAASAVRTGWSHRAPLVAVISDPADAERSSRWWRGLRLQGGPVDVICASTTVQRRLVGLGIPAEATIVIRPGVDFGAVRRAKETVCRSDLGLPPTGRVLLTPSPPSTAGGQYHAVWAAALLHQIWPDACMIIPGRSREQRRLRRFVHRLYCPEIYFLTEDRFSPAELLAVSDMLTVPATGDIGIGWLAWAMAASVLIVGAAVPSVTEIIADRHNGFLYKPDGSHALALRIRAAAESGDLLHQCVRTARSQAFDVFRAQRCVDGYLKVIRNLLAGRRAIAGVCGAAIA